MGKIKKDVCLSMTRVISLNINNGNKKNISYTFNYFTYKLYTKSLVKKLQLKKIVLFIYYSRRI